VTSPAPAKARSALLRYRVMAFVTGTVLIAGTIALILQKVFDVNHLDVLNAILWVAHGYLYLTYVVVTLQLGIRLRWPILRMLLVMAAGTIPTMSFVAEHYVTRDARAAGVTRDGPASV
jgi:integral membrane protein